MTSKSGFRYFFLLGILLTFWGIGITPICSAAPWEDQTVWSGLNLTPEQGRFLQNLMIQFNQEEKEIRRNMMGKRMELKTLSPEEFRGEKGEELRRQLQALMFRARERALYYQQEALSILTPEQRKKLPPDCQLGFHCPNWFRRGGGPGMGMGRGRGNPKAITPGD